MTSLDGVARGVNTLHNTTRVCSSARMGASQVGITDKAVWTQVEILQTENNKKRSCPSWHQKCAGHACTSRSRQADVT